MAFKAGELAYVKTTGETVFVLQFPDEVYPGSARVRRPVAGRDGIEHRVDYFIPEELETSDEQRTRFIAEQEELAKKYGPQASKQSPNSDGGFTLN